MIKRNSVLLATAVSFLVGCGGLSDPDTQIEFTPQTEPAGDIVTTLAKEGNFQILSNALQISGMSAMLSEGEHTLFAPVDQAMAAIGEEALNALFSNPQALSSVLQYHIVQNRSVNSGEIASLVGSSLTTSTGGGLQVSANSSRNTPAPQALYVNDAEVFVADVPNTNGIIHVIDRPLLPPGSEALLAGGNTNQPQNESVDSSESDTSSNSNEETMDIVQVAAAQGDLTTLVAGLRQTGLDSVLADTSKQFTVFAPTDQAFSFYDSNSDLLDDNDKLRSVLLYHVVEGRTISASQARALSDTNITMADGKQVFLSSFNGQLFANYFARINLTEISAGNGVIHKLDLVLYPSGFGF